MPFNIRWILIDEYKWRLLKSVYNGWGHQTIVRKPNASRKIAAKTIDKRPQNFPLLRFAIVRRQLWRVTLFKLNSTLFLHKIDDHNSRWHFLREMLLEKLQSEAGLNSCICWTGSLQLHRTQDKWQAILLTHSSITSKSSDSYFILQCHIILLIELPREKKDNFTKDDKIKGADSLS